MRDKANSLIKEFGTRDPFRILEGLGIPVVFEDLGMLNGYYIKANGVKIIKINSNLNERQQYFTAAHELGHALFHEDVNVPFLNAFTYMRTGRFEREANAFAAFLLISDEEVEQCRDLSIPKIMEVYNISEQLVHDRFISTYE